MYYEKDRINPEILCTTVILIAILLFIKLVITLNTNSDNDKLVIEARKAAFRQSIIEYKQEHSTTVKINPNINIIKINQEPMVFK